MFTTGQLFFGAIFSIIFIILMVISYKKDAQNHAIHYQNSAVKVAFWGTLTIAIFLLFRYHEALRSLVFGH